VTGLLARIKADIFGRESSRIYTNKPLVFIRVSSRWRALGGFFGISQTPARTLRSSPAFAVAAVLTPALGIGDLGDRFSYSLTKKCIGSHSCLKRDLGVRPVQV
jgi:hypothetical protein